MRDNDDYRFGPGRMMRPPDPRDDAAARQNAALRRRVEELEAELAALRQFRDDVVTVLGCGHMTDQMRLNVRLNSYSERSALLIEGILANEAAAIRARKEGR